jgi:NDP-sugar pyrophosphorylase family protein
MEPSVLEHIPEGYFDFPDLIRALLDAGLPVGTYPYPGFWLDIGRRDDYELATQKWAERDGGTPDE